MKKGDVKGAVVEYCSAVDLMPQDSLLRNEFAQALEANGAQAEAVGERRRFLELHPNQADQRALRQGAGAKLRALGAKP